jgi:hypothetical protein
VGQVRVQAIPMKMPKRLIGLAVVLVVTLIEPLAVLGPCRRRVRCMCSEPPAAGTYLRTIQCRHVVLSTLPSRPDRDCSCAPCLLLEDS